MKKLLMYGLLTSLPVLPALLEAAEEVRKVDGLSIVGNRELPSSLIIVPWKSATYSDQLHLPKKSIVEQGFDFVSRDQLLREIKFYKLQK